MFPFMFFLSYATLSKQQGSSQSRLTYQLHKEMFVQQPLKPVLAAADRAAWGSVTFLVSSVRNISSPSLGPPEQFCKKIIHSYSPVAMVI